MADPKQLIFQENEVPLPDTYLLPAGLDLAINSVVAFIDGGSAAGDFRPTLAIFAQSGQLMARIPCDQTFAAGDSGVVTWAPFLRKRATGGGAQTWNASAARAELPGITIPNATPTIVNGAFNSFAGTFVGTYVDFDAVAEDVRFIASCVGSLYVLAQWDTPFTGDRYIEASVPGGGGSGWDPNPGSFALRSPVATEGEFDTLAAPVLRVTAGTPQPVTVTVFQASGGPQDLAFLSCSIAAYDPVDTT